MSFVADRGTLRVVGAVRKRESGVVFVEVLEPCVHLCGWADVGGEEPVEVGRRVFDELADLCAWIGTTPALVEEWDAVRRDVAASASFVAARELLAQVGDCFDAEGRKCVDEATFSRLQDAYSRVQDEADDVERACVLALANRLCCPRGERLWQAWDVLDVVLESSASS